MFSQRWSTFSLLSITVTTGFTFFLIGRISISVPHKVAKEAQIISNRAERSKEFGEASGSADSAKSSSQQEINGSDTYWEKLSNQPRTPGIEAEIISAIEKMAESDPQRALSLAETETNFRLRAAMFRAALKTWGKTNPDAAALWVQTQTVFDREQAVSALLNGAVQNSEKALGVIATLTQNDPAHAARYGSDLIWAFAEDGKFDEAAKFAGNGSENNRSDWMLAAYSRWAEFQPQAAAAAAQNLRDPALQQAALDAVIVGWSPTDPRGMAEFALKNLSAEQQNAALSRALSFWADSDPTAAAEWINQQHLGVSSDVGVAEIALSPQLAQAPDTAVSWAKTITDPNLRSRTLVSILEGWAKFNPAAVRQFLNSTADVQSDDLSTLLAELNTPMNSN